MIETAIKPKSEPAGGHDDICEAVGRSFDRAFARMGTNPKSVTTTFEAALEGLRKAKNPELRLRSIAKSAALSTGRCHGNVVETGRVMLDQLESLSEKHGFKAEIAKDQILLGIAEGACQIGPVVYCRFLDVACDYKEGADDWIARNRKLPVPHEPITLPVIVPYENELTIASSSPIEPSAALPSGGDDAAVSAENNDEVRWSRPKQKRSIFSRLSDAVGVYDTL